MGSDGQMLVFDVIFEESVEGSLKAKSRCAHHNMIMKL